MEIRRDHQISQSLFRNLTTESSRKGKAPPLDRLGFGWYSTAAFFLLMTAAMAAIAGFAKFPRKERAHGEVVGSIGMKRVTLNRPGIVSEIHVDQGDIVKKGQRLVTISYDRNIGDTSFADSSLDAAKAQWTFKHESMTDDLAALAYKISEINQDSDESHKQLSLNADLIALKLEQIDDKQRTVDAMSKMRDQQIVSEIQYRAARGDLLDNQQQLISLQREQAQLQTRIEKNTSAKLQLERHLSSSTAMLSAEKAAFEEKSIALLAESGETLTAPLDGRISSIIASNGEAVLPGSSLLIITSADHQLVGQAWVKSSAIGFIKVGSEVKLRIAAFPYRKFGTLTGTVKEIEKAPTPLRDLPPDLQATEAMYRVAIALPPTKDQAKGSELDAARLSDGMKFDADFMMERRTLLERLFDPAKAALSEFE